jgi:hypothetical protein
MGMVMPVTVADMLAVTHTTVRIQAVFLSVRVTMVGIVKVFLGPGGALVITGTGFTAIRALGFMALAGLAAMGRASAVADLVPAGVAGFMAVVVGRRAGLAGAIPVNA